MWVEMKWPTAKDTQIAGFDTSADRHEALQDAQLQVGVNPLSHTVATRTLLNRALPTLDGATHSDLLLNHFMESLPEDL
ncbi:unnamed protein product [Echinostoma caproni]|uniref:Transposase n=1 Tax=Echinostoma caproni TaxID=27848 RepID=A0A183A2Z0_9TREM|nr:unnamed protein product [Echinostoma caproni]